MTNGSAIDGIISAITACRGALATDIRRVLSPDRRSSSDKPLPSLELRASRRGAPSARVEGKWIHSSVDPARESARSIQQATSDHASNADGTLIDGMGLGYVLDDLANLEPASAPRPWIAVCYHPELLVHALETRGDSWWCAHGPDRIIAADEGPTLATTLIEAETRAPRYIPQRGVRSAFPEQAKAISETFRSFTTRNTMNRNTLRRFGTSWVRNAIANTQRYGALPGIEALSGCAPDLPVLVLAAGPTLDETLPLLNTLAEKSLLIAVDTAAVAALRAGRAPDLTVVSDPQYWNSRHFDLIRTADTVLIADPATHPRSIRNWPGIRRMSASLFPLGSYFDRYAGRTVRLGAGGSVATSAWDLARLLGASTIAMAGADLGFPGYQTHSIDSFFERRICRISHRTIPAEQHLHRYLHGAHTQLVPSVGGEQIPSDARMSLYREWFSEQARRHPHVRNYLLSSRSSAIDGFEYCAAAEWLERHGDAARTREARNQIRVSCSVPGEATGGIDDSFTELYHALRVIGDAASDGLSVLAGVPDDTTDPRIQLVFDKLNRIDARIQGVGNREIAGFLNESLLADIAALQDGSVRGALSAALELYRSVDESARYHRRLIARYRGLAAEPDHRHT